MIFFYFNTLTHKWIIPIDIGYKYVWGFFFTFGGDSLDLIIVRHGKAEDISQKPEGSDFNRSLTDEGVVQVRTMAKILKGITKYNWRL